MASEFKCNAPSCSTLLGERVCLISCGHALCAEHGKEWFSSHQTCPICNRQVNVTSANFSKKYINERKRIALIGFNPSEILESAGVGLEFWQAQKNLEVSQVKNLASQRENVYREKVKQTEQAFYATQQGYLELKDHYKQLAMQFQHLQQQNTQLTQENQQLKSNMRSPQVFDPPSNRKIFALGEQESNFSTNKLFSGISFDTGSKPFKRPFTPHASSLFTPSKLNSS
ncbi:unnamed protein product [Blepharisma stoltei]|uniref:RING-type domain-containing protein n=1 Tax=Blepharisma stoltei TaxID=1481888 RepID=A0AAU9K7F1_9CILI|nr:unnamed protein product [Blepharisma stoltei]